MKSIKLIIFCIALSNLCYSQTDYSEDWFKSGWEYSNKSDSIVDVSAQVIDKNDLTYLLKYPYPQYGGERKVMPDFGLLGNDFKKIEILFTDISQDKSELSSYNIIGNIKIGDEINNLSGKIIFKNASVYIPKSQEPQTVVLVGLYTFDETVNNKKIAYHSGSVKIVLFTKDIFASNSSFYMDAYSEEGATKAFVGTRKINKSSIAQSCIWGFSRFFEYAKDFDLGCGEEMINIKYAKDWFDFTEQEWDSILKENPTDIHSGIEEYIEPNELDWFKSDRLNETDLAKIVLKQLHLKPDKVAEEFITMCVFNKYLNETIVVIPEIENEPNQEELYYQFTSHILIVNSITGKIKYHFQETSEKNGWYSDAIRMTDIVIDTNTYPITKAENAFGIRVHFQGSSQPNPYYSTYLSLYIKEGEEIKKVLDNLPVSEIAGTVNVRLDTCAATFEKMEKDVFVGHDTANGYYNLVISKKVVNTIYQPNAEGDCIEKEIKDITEQQILRYDSTTYKLNPYEKNN